MIQHGHGVETLGEDSEPLAGHRVVFQEAFGPPLQRCGGVDVLLRGEVAAPGLWTEGAQAVGHGIRQPQFRHPFQPAAQGGGGRPVAAGQLAHRGQRGGAQLQQRVLLLPTQGGNCRASVPCGTVEVGGYALRGSDGPGCRVDSLYAVAHAAQDGPGQGAAHPAPVQEAPEGVARDAEGFHHLLTATPPDVGVHVVVDGGVQVVLGQLIIDRGRRPGVGCCHYSSSRGIVPTLHCPGEIACP